MEGGLDTNKAPRRTLADPNGVELRQPKQNGRRQTKSGERPRPTRRTPRSHAEGHRSSEKNPQSRPPRRSLRLQEKRNINQQVEHADKPQKGQPKVDYKDPLVERNSKRLPRDKVEPKPPPASLEAHKHLRRLRDIEDQDVFDRGVKRTKHNETEESIPRIDHSKDKFIEAWLGSEDDEKPLGEFNLAAGEVVLPLVDRDSASLVTSPTKTAKSKSMGPYESEFRPSLARHNIYIEKDIPPPGLMQKANQIVTGLRSSPELDEAATTVSVEMLRALRDEAEQDVIQLLAPFIIPQTAEALRRELKLKAGLPWKGCVPVPLDPSYVFTNGVSLSKPSPDETFGYSDMAFTNLQLSTIDLLKGLLRQSYATPIEGLHFPFMSMEFKSQATGGTQYIAKNQAANAGAVAGHGLVELARRGLGLDSLDYNEPQFFSLGIDQEGAHVCVHWLAEKDGQFFFHMEDISQHSLRNLGGLRAVRRIVKNILDWGRDERLPAICKQLDAYERNVRAGRVAALASGSTAEPGVGP
ncbi:hypothetical protein GP486_001424 [Trichoglossum hirsutum]|uniref:DUF7924 domain-containing protein n=1 Tax=Trichoglossum hirsutum TaxID=265104 RepID=A0A9P8LH26_9PEZI|nr:hypothetical protein GP486_001424 [Trichoglossum hirsutum]